MNRLNPATVRIEYSGENHAGHHEGPLLAESTSTFSSKSDTNTQISTVRNESVNCRWILQGGEHNLLRFTDSNRPGAVIRVLIT